MQESYSEVTHDICISVVPAPLPASSDLTRSVYAFSYTVTVENLGAYPVQLMERHWHVFSAEYQIAEVVGPGVLGLQPKIEPSESFTYTSGTVLDAPVGYMYGTYTFHAKQGEEFLAKIPRFNLVYPVMYH